MNAILNNSDIRHYDYGVNPFIYANLLIVLYNPSQHSISFAKDCTPPCGEVRTIKKIKENTRTPKGIVVVTSIAATVKLFVNVCYQFIDLHHPTAFGKLQSSLHHLKPKANLVRASYIRKDTVDLNGFVVDF
jgi:hypothetical protein